MTGGKWHFFSFFLLSFVSEFIIYYYGVRYNCTRLNSFRRATETRLDIQPLLFLIPLGSSRPITPKSDKCRSQSPESDPILFVVLSQIVRSHVRCFKCVFYRLTINTHIDRSVRKSSLNVHTDIYEYLYAEIDSSVRRHKRLKIKQPREVAVCARSPNRENATASSIFTIVLWYCNFIRQHEDTLWE